MRSRRSSGWPTGFSWLPIPTTSARALRRRRCSTPGRWRWRSSTTSSGHCWCWPPRCSFAAARPARSGWSFSCWRCSASVGSAAASIWLSGDAAELNRVYFGTDTRAQALLIGAAAAALLVRDWSALTSVGHVDPGPLAALGRLDPAGDRSRCAGAGGAPGDRQRRRVPPRSADRGGAGRGARRRARSRWIRTVTSPGPWPGTRWSPSVSSPTGSTCGTGRSSRSSTANAPACRAGRCWRCGAP